ncbi:RidA family protein [Bacillus marinisedimentorum]|uniref:RidA family protein n=1 Tax=Bacillus marinisedimentorum TaxID=1821260 RepID=UPI000A65AF6D|nr:RidA family protein [Bacillus marinisedimentorum]
MVDAAGSRKLEVSGTIPYAGNPIKHGAVEDKLAASGYELPDPPSPAGNYLAAIRSGQLLYISGVTCKWNGKLEFKGKVGEDFTVEEGYEAARITTLNHLAIIKETLGSLDKVARIIKITGYVNCSSDFTEIPQVLNGSSDLAVKLLGEEGKHIRCAVGVNSLPGGAAVETDMIIEVND